GNSVRLPALIRARADTVCRQAECPPPPVAMVRRRDHPAATVRLLGTDLRRAATARRLARMAHRPAAVGSEDRPAAPPAGSAGLRQEAVSAGRRQVVRIRWLKAFLGVSAIRRPTALPPVARMDSRWGVRAQWHPRSAEPPRWLPLADPRQSPVR